MSGRACREAVNSLHVEKKGLPKDSLKDHVRDMTELLTRTCSSADEFLDVLRPSSNRSIAQHRTPYEWAFRGQASADWKLTPTALRPGTVLGFYGDRRQHVSEGRGGDLEQMNGEVVAVRQFVEVADRIGLPIPGAHPFFRQDGFDLGTYGVAAVAGQVGLAEWPKPEMLELLAIAQHHGVSTRLLDFTHSPLIAAFFAAFDVVENKCEFDKQGVTEFAVWGVNIQELRQWGMEFEVVEVERAKNAFLQAQKGLFVLDRRAWDGPPGSISRSLDERICSVTGGRHSEVGMVKATLPLDQAPIVLRLLAIEGVDLPHLMPTYDNVVAHLQRVQASNRG